MQIFTKSGHFIKKIAIRYIDIVAGLAVTSQGHIVAVDSVSPTVFVISDTGDLLRWFDCSDYMREPSDIAISGERLLPFSFFFCNNIATGGVTCLRKDYACIALPTKYFYDNACDNYYCDFIFDLSAIFHG